MRASASSGSETWLADGGNLIKAGHEVAGFDLVLARRQAHGTGG